MENYCDQYHAFEQQQQQQNLYPATIITTTTARVASTSFSSINLLVVLFSLPKIFVVVLPRLILSWVPILMAIVIIATIAQFKNLHHSILSSMSIFLKTRKNSHKFQSITAPTITPTTTIVLAAAAVVLLTSSRTTSTIKRAAAITTQRSAQVIQASSLQRRAAKLESTTFLFHSNNRVIPTSTQLYFGTVRRPFISSVIVSNLKKQSTTMEAIRSSSSNSNNSTKPSPMNGSCASNMDKPKAKLTYDIKACGERIRIDGKLVAFPTETVYGLGANIYNIDAIKSIFRAKERPYSDPLIVHVLEPKDAYVLWDAFRTTPISGNNSCNDNDNSNNNNNTEEVTEVRILQALCTSSLWPGPLTIVAKANTDHVNEIIMANTGYCAIRSPSNLIARQLLLYAQVPIAAPSANKFGHVSPTTSQHVYDDLYNEDVWILTTEPSSTEVNDVDESSTKQQQQQQYCEVGVESTVAKVEEIVNTAATNNIIGDDTVPKMTTRTSSFVITILRQGSVSAADITDCLRNAGLFVSSSSSSANNNNNNSTTSNRATISVVSNVGKKYDKRAASTANSNDDEHIHDLVDDDAAVASVAPGQAIRHYSPNIPSFLVSDVCITEQVNPNDIKQQQQQYDDVLQTAVVIDYGQKLMAWKESCLAYRDLSRTKNSSEAARIVFDTLRWAETVHGASVILFPQSICLGNINHNNNDNDQKEDNDDDALAIAIKDKLTRAASGVVVNTIQDIVKMKQQI